MTRINASLDIKPLYLNYTQGQQPYEVGQLIKGTVISKTQAGSSIQFEGQDYRLFAPMNVGEAEGEIANFEVVENSGRQLSLRYLEADTSTKSPLEELSEMKPVQVVKDYQKTIRESLKQFDSNAMADINKLMKEAQASIDAIASSMTDEDLSQMMKDGLNPEKESLGILSQVLKHNKAMVRDLDSQGIREAVEAKVQDLKGFYNNEAQLKEVVSVLKDVQVPVNKKFVDKLMTGLNTLDDLKSAESRDALQILDNYKNSGSGKGGGFGHKQSLDNEPTLEGIYKSIHTPLPTTQAIGLEADELETMVVKHMENQGIQVTDEGVAVAKIMVERGIAISAEKINFVLEPQKVMAGIDPSELLEKMALQLRDSKNMTDIRLAELSFINAEMVQADVSEGEMVALSDVRQTHLSSTLTLINEISISQTVQAVLANQHNSLEEVLSVIQDKEMTLAKAEVNLAELDEEAFTEDLIKFKKQLSVIQLKMTLGVAIRMEKQGIKVDTAPIADLVENLEAQEVKLRESQLGAYSGGRSLDQKELQVYREAMTHVEGAKVMDPSVALHLQADESPITLRHIMTTATRVENARIAEEVQSQVAVAKYEESMTEIRRDLGDRLENTFSQIEPMLEEMGLAVTKANRQAVEILAKNAMPITDANILSVQIVQEKIDLIAEKLTPVVVVSMTQAGINPIDLTIDELLSVVAAFESENQQTETSKISELIVGLDDAKALTNEERQGLMAIYRTMDTVTRSQGAATGFMVKNDMNLTLNNLFEAAKYIRKTGQVSAAIQVDINDNFGLLEEVTNKASTLHEQVQMANGSSAVEESQGLELVRRELMDLRITSFIQSLSAQAYRSVVSTDSVEAVNALPLEELTALMDAQSKGEESTQVNADKYLTFLKENPEFLRTMIDQKIPLTFENFSKSIAMNQDSFLMMHEMESLLDKVQSPELRAQMIEKLAQVGQDILGSKVPYEALEEVIEEVQQSIRDGAEDEPASVYKSSAALKASVNHTQMIQVSEDYYQIPVFMNDQVSQLNLYIMNQEKTVNSQGESKILMSFEAGNLGKVQALMTLDGNNAALQVQSSFPEDKAILQRYEAAFTEVIGQSNYNLGHVSYETFREKEPINVTKEAMSHAVNNHLPDGHIDWSV